MTQLTVTNMAGVSFNAVLRLPGQPLWNCLTQDHTRQPDAWQRERAIVEVFDATHEGDPRFGRFGRYVASHCLTALVEAAARGRGAGALSVVNVAHIAGSFMSAVIDAYVIA